MKAIAQLFDNFAAGAMAVISIVTFLQVISRYVFNIPIGWATDIIRFSFIYLIFLGSTIATREKSHLNIDFLTSIMPAAVQKAITFFVNVFMCFFLVYLIKYGFDFTLASKSQKMPYLDSVSISFLYASIPICGVFMLIYIVKDAYERLKQSINK